MAHIRIQLGQHPSPGFLRCRLTVPGLGVQDEFGVQGVGFKVYGLGLGIGEYNPYITPM